MEEEGHTIVPANIDEAVAEFNKARGQRMATRRARVNERITALKAAQGITAEVASNSSSTDLLIDNTTAEGRDITSGGEEDKKSGSAGAESTSKKHHSQKRTEEQDEIKKITNQHVTENLDQQIEESRKQLEQMILDGEMLITNVRVAAQYREKVRQAKAEENRKDRLARLRQDAEESQIMYDKLSENWKMKAEKTLPMEMFEQMKSQQEACDELIAKKDELINNFKREIAEREFDYDGDLEMYQKDSMLMGDRIDDLITDLRMAFIEELNLIEDYTCKNREVTLEDNQADWMNLLADFEAMEQKNLEDRKADALAKFQILNEFFIQTKQEARRLRHKIEDDFRILFQEREQAKYACHINLEKVIYNLHVLKCRSKENLELKNRMKRLIIKLHDKFEVKAAGLRKKMEMGGKYVEKLSKEIQRVETNVETFGQKTLHLALWNHKTYMELWETNEETARDRAKKLLESDKFIYETQFGEEYAVPDMAAVFDARPKEVNNYFKKKLRGMAEDDKKNPKDGKKDSKKGSKKDSKDSKKSTQSSRSSSDSDYEEGEERSSLVDDEPVVKPKELTAEDPAMQRRLMKAIGKMICDPLGLLIEEELQKILIPLFMTEKNLVNLDAVVMALGVTDADEIRSLSRYLLKYCKVLQGVIPWSDSDQSAGVNEMNVSLTGVIGKAAALLDQDDSDEASDEQSLEEDEPDLSDHSVVDDNACFHDPEQFCECKIGKKKAREEAEQKKKAKAAERKASKKPSKKSLGTKDDGRKSGQQANLDEELQNGHLCGDVVCCSPQSSTVFLDGVDSDQDLEGMLNDIDQEEDGEDRNPEDDGIDCSLNTSKATVLSWLEPDERQKMIEELNIFNAAMSQECDLMAAEKIERAKEKEREKELLEYYRRQAEELEEEWDEEEAEMKVKNSMKLSRMGKLEDYLMLDLVKTGEYDGEGAEEDAKPRDEDQDKLEQEKLLEAEKLFEEQEKPEEEEEEKKEEEEEEEEEEEDEEWGGEGEEDEDDDEEEDEEEVEEEEETDSLLLICPREPRPRRYTKEEQRDMMKAGILTLPGIMDKPEGEGSEFASDSAHTYSVFSYESFTEDSEDDYLYVDPDEVVEALKRFIDDYNNRMKLFAPTMEGTIRKKLANIKYPSFTHVSKYWDAVMNLLNPKGKDIWDTVQTCFDEYNKVLKERNENVIAIQKFYQQNYELGHLLQKYFQSSYSRYSRRTGPYQTGPWDRQGLYYC